MGEPSAFVIRRSDRHEITLPVRLRVHDPDRSQVRLSSRSGQREGWVNADLVDLARGGMGVVSPVFFPRECRVDLEVMGVGESDTEPLLDMTARVRRVVMTDRRPAYQIGLLFVSLTETQSSRLDQLLERISGVGTPSEHEGAHVRD